VINIMNNVNCIMKMFKMNKLSQIIFAPWMFKSTISSIVKVKTFKDNLKKLKVNMEKVN